MNPAAAPQHGPHEQPPALVLLAKLLEAPHKHAPQLREIRERAHIHRRDDEPDAVNRRELDARHLAAVDLHDNGALRAAFAGLGAPALEVARVDDPGAALAQELALMDVPESPVVHAGRLEVAHSGRAAAFVFGIHPRGAVEQPHVEPRGRGAREARGQVLAGRALREADAVDGGQADALALDRRGLHRLVAEHLDALGPGLDGRPPLRRIVIAVDDESLDPPRAQALQAPQHAELRAHAALGPVVVVAGEEHEGRVVANRAVDQGVERFQRRVAKLRRDGGRHPRDALEGRIQMHIGGMNERETHSASSPIARAWIARRPRAPGAGRAGGRARRAASKRRLSAPASPKAPEAQYTPAHERCKKEPPSCLPCLSTL